MALTSKGQALGLATLTSGGKLTSGQVPTALAGLSAGATVADQSALTTAAPAALTATAPAALTSANATGGDAPTEAEYNALRADVVALRTTLAAAVVDLAALRTPLAAAVVDLGAERTTVLALLASLRAAGLIAT